MSRSENSLNHANRRIGTNGDSQVPMEVLDLMLARRCRPRGPRSASEWVTEPWAAVKA